MKLLSTIAAGAVLLAGCAPFEHGHYLDDVQYINDVGDRPGTPVIVNAAYDDTYYQEATGSYGVEQHYSAPIQIAAPAPVHVSHPAPVHVSHPAPVHVAHPAPVHHVSHPAPVHVSHPAPVHVAHPAPVHHVAHPAPAVYVERQAPIHHPPVVHHQAPVVHAPPPPTIVQVAAPPPPPTIIQVSAPVVQQPIVAATTVSEERYVAETVYARPEVINAPPVFVRNGQYSNRPFPAPSYPSFGGAQDFGSFPGLPGSAVHGMTPSRTAYGSGGCVMQCSGGVSVF